MLSNDEFAPFYAGYIESAGTTDILLGLEEGLKNGAFFFKNLPENKWEYCYAPGKWTPKELLLHIIDSERVFSYRAMVIARADNATLAGFDQDEYVKNSDANNRKGEDLLSEFIMVRQATMALFKSFSEEILSKKGTANGTMVSIRALGLIINGHANHHLKILEERYV